MRRCLLLISFLLIAVLCYSQALKVSSLHSQKYGVSITFSNASITGICILRDYGEQIVGSVINEFGIKAFDFIYDKKKDKAKLKNTIKILDKWYIRKVISGDLSVLVRDRNKQSQLRKRILISEYGHVRLENRKYHIIYKFSPINDIER
ncbi:hypothetical protein [Parabacteroides sp.]